MKTVSNNVTKQQSKKGLVAVLVLAAVAVGLAILLRPAVFSDTVVSNEAIKLEGVWARPSRAPMESAHGEMSHGHGGATHGSTSAAFMIIHNEGQQDDALIAARTEVAAVTELHESKIVNDVMEMHPVEQIVVPAGGNVELKPGGLHVMFMGVHEDLSVGDEFTVVLVFERAGEISVNLTVREP